MKLLFLILLILLIIFIAIFMIIFIRKRKDKKRKNDIIKLFVNACKEKNIDDYKIEYVKNGIYDFYFEDSNDIFYIKIINNFSSQEICINNAIKWQLRTFNSHNEKLNFVDGVEALMRLDLKNILKKEHKLFIIYPNVTALLKVINECEMTFVYPETDVFGSKVISYKKLLEDVNVLDL